MPRSPLHSNLAMTVRGRPLVEGRLSKLGARYAFLLQYIIPFHNIDFVLQIKVKVRTLSE